MLGIPSSLVELARAKFEELMTDTVVIKTSRLPPPGPIVGGSSSSLSSVLSMTGILGGSESQPNYLSNGRGGVVGDDTNTDSGYFVDITTYGNPPKPLKCRLQIGYAPTSLGQVFSQPDERTTGTVVLPYEVKVNKADKLLVTDALGRSYLLEVQTPSMRTDGITNTVEVVLFDG